MFLFGLGKVFLLLNSIVSSPFEKIDYLFITNRSTMLIISKYVPIPVAFEANLCKLNVEIYAYSCFDLFLALIRAADDLQP